MRTDGSNMLVEGYGDDYGWMSNYAMFGGTLGDYDPGGGRPSWWVGRDEFDGRPVGPHGPWGPGAGYGFGYGWDPRARIPHGGWWNNEQTGLGILPAVTRCTGVVTNPVLGSDWVLDTPSGPRRPPLWVRDPMLAATVPGDVAPVFPAGARLARNDFWATVLTHALWWGKGVFAFMEAADGQPLAGTSAHFEPVSDR